MMQSEPDWIRRYRSEPEFRPTVALGKKGAKFLRELLALFSAEGNKAMVEDVLARGAAVNGLIGGSTPLCRAAEKGHVQVVQLLLKSGASPDTRSERNVTPLIMASMNGHEETVSVLLASGAKVEAKDRDGRTALHMACASGHLGIIRKLLEAGADCAVLDKYGKSPLVFAAERGNTPALEILLENRAPNEESDREVIEVLFMAAKSGHVEALDLLFRHGAPTETKIKGLSLLHIAAVEGKREGAESLLNRGLDPDEHDNKPQMTPLSIACQCGNIDVAEVLLDHGANVNHEDCEMQTPLLAACVAGHIEIVRLLLNRGANIDARDNQGLTGVFWAVDKSHFAGTAAPDRKKIKSEFN